MSASWPRYLHVLLPELVPLPRVGKVIYLRDEPSFSLVERSSREFEFHWVTHGSLTPVCAGESMELKAGDWLLTPPGKRYGFKAQPGRIFSCFHAHFSWPGIKVSDRRRSKSWALPAWTTIPRQEELAERLMALIRMQRARHAGFSWAVGAGLLSIFHKLAAETAQRSNSTDEPPVVTVAITRALDFIESHLHRPLALEEVAAHLELNPAYLARVFKTNTQETVGQYVARRKMEVARERMLTTRMSIKAVAHSLGFRDAAYFSRVFKKVTGRSPRAFESRNAF